MRLEVQQIKDQLATGEININTLILMSDMKTTYRVPVAFLLLTTMHDVLNECSGLFIDIERTSLNFIRVSKYNYSKKKIEQTYEITDDTCLIDSVLFYLTATTKGIEILKMINSAEIEWEFFNYTCTVGDYAGKSAASNLLTTPDGRDFLKKHYLHIDQEKLFDSSKAFTHLYQSEILIFLHDNFKTAFTLAKLHITRRGGPAYDALKDEMKKQGGPAYEALIQKEHRQTSASHATSGGAYSEVSELLDEDPQGAVHTEKDLGSQGSTPQQDAASTEDKKDDTYCVIM
jgi:hypothetical protein